MFTLDDYRMTRKTAEDLRGVVDAELRRQWGEGMREQRQVARVRGVVRADPKSEVRKTFQITARLYHLIGERCGYHVWEDPEFVPWLQKNYEEMRVRTEMSLTAVHGYVPKDVKFHKSYG